VELSVQNPHHQFRPQAHKQHAAVKLLKQNYGNKTNNNDSYGYSFGIDCDRSSKYNGNKNNDNKSKPKPNSASVPGHTDRVRSQHRYHA